MKIMRSTLAVAIAALGVLLASAPSPAAATVNPRTLTTAQVRVDGAGADGLSSGNVACPAGTKVIAAGLGHARMTGLIAFPAFNAVAASGAPEGTGADQFMVIQVTCAPEAQLNGFIQRQVTFPFTGSVVRRGVITCPAGMYAVGGGGIVFTSTGAIRAGAPMLANTPSADGRSWIVTSLDAISGDSLRVNTQCSPNDTSTLRELSLPTNQPSSDVVDCGITGFSFGAGLSVLASDGTEARDGAINQLTQLGTRGWFVRGTSPTPNTRLVVRLRCVEP